MEKKENTSFRDSMIKTRNDHGQDIIRMYLSLSLKEKLINVSGNLEKIIFTFLLKAAFEACDEHIADLKDKQDAMLGKVGALKMWGRKHFGGSRGMYKLLQHKIRLLEALTRDIKRISNLQTLGEFLTEKEAVFNEIGDLFIKKLQEKMLSSSVEQNAVYDVPVLSLPEEIQKQISETDFIEITSLKRIQFLSKILAGFVISH